MHLIGLVLIVGGILSKTSRVLKYGLVTSGWVIVGLQYLIIEKNWIFAAASIILGAMFMVFVAYEEKRNKRTK